MIDTAAVYRNEGSIGESLSDLVNWKGSYSSHEERPAKLTTLDGLCRRDFFLVSKLQPKYQGYQKTLSACLKVLSSFLLCDSYSIF